MYSVGLDVDTNALVSTELSQFFTDFVDFGEREKILLCAGNFCLSSPLVLVTLGKIYFKNRIFSFLPLLNLKAEKSAGNFSISTNATASGKNTYNSYSSLPKISEHLPKHNLTDSDSASFGFFLAGLIEGDGWFGHNQLHIIFSERDVSLAFFIKKRIGYGNVYKIKNKKAFRYICKHKTGLALILDLINGKFVSSFKYDQLLKQDYQNIFNLELLAPSNTNLLNNYWLSGFTQVDGCFHISIVKSKTHKVGFSVRLEFSIKQNDAIPLKLLFSILNMGNISQYNSGIWCYKSTGYKTAAVLIDYFDKYPVFGGKYVDYLKFRKVYSLITQGKHLEAKGLFKIKSITTKGSSETSTQEVE